MKLDPTKLTNLTSPVGLIALAFSGAAFVVSVVSARKLSKACEKLDTEVDTLISSEADEIHIAQDVIDRAIDNQVRKRVDTMMPKALEDGKREATRLFNSAVHSTIIDMYSDIEKQLQAKVNDKINRIDLNEMTTLIVQNGAELVKNRMKDSVKGIEDDFRSDLEDELNDLKDEARSSFDERVDDLVDEFESRLDDIVKIYSAVASRYTVGKEN